MPVLLKKSEAVRSNETSLYRAAIAIGDWDEQARQHALKVPNDYPAEFAAWLEAEVKAGRSFCIHALHDGRRIGTGICAVIEEGGVKRAFLQSGYVLPDVPPGYYWEKILPAIEAEAKRRGCAIFQTATSRPALVQAYRRHGWGVVEVGLAKKLF